MKLEEFLQQIENLPVIDTEMLLVGSSDHAKAKVQISRWVKSGKLIQLKRGLYVLAPLYRKIEPFEPFIAAVLKQPSYISLEKALEFHGMIPEGVRVYTSLTTKWQDTFKSKLGIYSYQHIRKDLFWGYESVTLRNQTGFIAVPEKAILDYLYVKKIKLSPRYLNELRLQNVNKVGKDKLIDYADKFNKPGMVCAAEMIVDYIEKESAKEKTV